MSPRVFFIWLSPCHMSLQLPLWYELENMITIWLSHGVMLREDPDVSWPCIYGSLYLQSFTQEFLEAMVCCLNYSNSQTIIGCIREIRITAVLR